MRKLNIPFLSCLLFSLVTLSAGAQNLSLERQDRERMKRETVHAIDVMQSLHYSQKSFAEIAADDLLNAYMEELDSARLFFLSPDVEFILKRFGPTLKPTYLFVGDLYPAFEIFNNYTTRVKERIDWIQNRLQQDFDLHSDSVYRPDRSEASWPATAEEADQLWENRLKFELIGELLEEETLERAKEKIARRYERMNRYIGEIEIHNVQETFLSALAGLYDPHSSFFSWDTAREFDIQISNSLIGIGAQLREVDGYCVIERLMPGGPAEMSGQLHPGDKVVAVAQGSGEPVDVVDMKLRKVVQMIRGEEGTEVRLTVIPADSSERRVLSLKRQRVELTANLAKAELFEIPDSAGNLIPIGVISLPSFYGEGDHGENPTSTSRDIEELIVKLKERDIRGLILDLRHNGGGRLDEAIKMTGLFIPRGPVVMRRSFNGRVDEEWDRDPGVAYSGPLAVLVSRGSASASEIVAGALQAANRALVIGDAATHGKGTVQQPIDLRSTIRSGGMFGSNNSSDMKLGMVKLTIHQFYLPNGSSTQQRGVEADIAFPSVNDFLLEGEKDLKNALPWDSIEPVAFPFLRDNNHGLSLISPELLASLRALTEQRQEELEEFKFQKANISWMRDRYETKEFTLNLDVRREQRLEDRKMNEWARLERERLSTEMPFNSVSIDLDVTRNLDKSHQTKLRENPLPNGMDRANQFYQKVYYYQADAESDIKELWVEFFDYLNLQTQSAQITSNLNETSGLEITEDQVNSLLTRFRNSDRGVDFDVQGTIRDVLGDVMDEAMLESFLPHFFAALVKADPTILRDRPALDIPLREALRIVGDWVAIAEGNLAMDRSVAAKVKLKSMDTE